MDIKIVNGDIDLGSNGLAVEVNEEEELLQRAKILLTVPRGSFIYNRKLGSRIYENMEEEKEKIILYAKECLKGMDIKIIGLNINPNTFIFSIETPYGENSLTISY